MLEDVSAVSHDFGKMNIGGTNKLHIIFTEEGLESFNVDMDLNIDIEVMSMPVNISMIQDVVMAIDEYNKSNTATTEYLADFVGTGDDEDEDGNEG